MDENGCRSNGAIVIAAFDFLVDYKQISVITDEETGKKKIAIPQAISNANSVLDYFTFRIIAMS